MNEYVDVSTQIYRHNRVHSFESNVICSLWRGVTSYWKNQSCDNSTLHTRIVLHIISIQLKSTSMSKHMLWLIKFI